MMVSNILKIKKLPLVIEAEEISFNNQTKKQLEEAQLAPEFVNQVKGISNKVFVYKIVYRSNGNKVIGYIVEPRHEKRNLPCLISNRGGTGNFGSLNLGQVFKKLGTMAMWGYVVAASQYSGSTGSEGVDDHGDKNIADVLNLYKILKGYSRADTTRIGMVGGSRGGMMTYRALSLVTWIKAAVVTAGLADYFRNAKERPEMKRKFKEIFGDSKAEKIKRSAVYWPKKFPKKTPLLLMHGTADWRVSPLDSLDLARKFYEHKIPYRLILFEGADHVLSEFREEKLRLTREWLDKYVKNKTPIPKLDHHGS